MTFELGRVHKTIPHLLADTFELVSACEDTPISNTSGYSILQNSVKSGEDIVDPDEEDLDDDGEPDEMDGSEISARDQGYIEDAFRVIEYRVRTFGSSYPFKLERGILRKKKKLSKLQKVYLFLLSCSRLRSFRASKYYSKLPDQFEILCRDVLAEMLPASATVVCFGPKSTDRRNRFHSDLRKAIPRLATFMGMGLSPDWKPEDYSGHGDGKLDLIGVQCLDSTELGWNVMLGQCAAQERDKDWERKRSEALFDRHVSKFYSPVKAQGVLFVPVSYRQEDGSFFNKDNVTFVIFMDRERILHLYDPSAASFSQITHLKDVCSAKSLKSTTSP